MSTADSPVTVRRLAAADGPEAVAAINTAAEWYAEFLTLEEVAEPEMTVAEWLDEGRRMTWFGAFEGKRLLGVMGSEPAGDAVLLRHAYVVPDRQRRGVAARLYGHIERQLPAGTRLIVGTYRDNYKARAALEKAGFSESADSLAVLEVYYDVAPQRRGTSVTYEKVIPRKE